MIQRIQSLYLLLAAMFAALMIWLPLATFLADDQVFKLTSFGLVEAAGEQAYVVPTIAMGIVIVLSALLPVVTVFMFRNRLLQVRMCFVEIVLLFGVLVFSAFYTYHAYKSMEIFQVMVMKFGIAAVFPLISLILTYMAFRRIAADEALVRSVNRIR